MLPIHSKIFKGFLDDQLEEWFNYILSIFLSAFHKNYHCQSVLFKICDDWKIALDKQQATGAIFIVLSKAFSHSLLLDKLKIMDYQIMPSSLWVVIFPIAFKEIGENVSKWGRVKCGVPQGWLIGPRMFNIFINDFVLHLRILYTGSHSTGDVDELVCQLESELRHI